MARTVSSSVAPGRTLGQTGSSGLRLSAITAHRRAMAKLLSQASGRSANSARIVAAGLNQCSAVTRRRSGSATARPAAMHSKASCASYIAGLAKKHSLVATSGSPAPSASAISPGSTARSSANPCRCNSTTVRSPDASAIACNIASASPCRPSASKRPNGPRVPPVNRNSPAAWSSTVRSGNCGSAGSEVVKPNDDRRCRLASPTVSCANSTTGSGDRPGLSVRTRLIWQPMIGCTPSLVQAWLNSSAPNRLLESVIAAAGIPASRAIDAILSALIAPSLSE